MGNALFIVWRESAEAMLVVGVLYAWLKNRADAATGMRYLWGGVAAGAGLAGVLALVMLGIASSLSGNGLDYFQLARRRCAGRRARIGRSGGISLRSRCRAEWHRQLAHRAHPRHRLGIPDVLDLAERLARAVLAYVLPRQ